MTGILSHTREPLHVKLARGRLKVLPHWFLWFPWRRHGLLTEGHRGILSVVFRGGGGGLTKLEARTWGEGENKYSDEVNRKVVEERGGGGRRGEKRERRCGGGGLDHFCLTTNGEEMKFGQGPAVCHSLVSVCAVVLWFALVLPSRLFACPE